MESTLSADLYLRGIQGAARAKDENMGPRPVYSDVTVYEETSGSRQVVDGFENRKTEARHGSAS